MTNGKMAEPLSIVPTKTDKEIAEELRAKLADALTKVCAVFDDAVAAGFGAQYKIGPDYRRKHIITEIIITKQF